MLHRVEDLSPEQKIAVETLLGRPVSEGESVSIKAITPVIVRSKLSAGQRKHAIETLRAYFSRIDARRQPVAEDEEEAIVNKTLRQVRASYEPIG